MFLPSNSSSRIQDEEGSQRPFRAQSRKRKAFLEFEYSENCPPDSEPSDCDSDCGPPSSSGSTITIFSADESEPRKDTTGEKKIPPINKDLFAVLSLKRPSTLPELSWANSESVWEALLSKEIHCGPRDHRMLKKHPELQPKMRAILLDWLIEVCEVYKLHRETFYLAQDYIDRYLTTKSNLPKNQLQLLGISCLFLAAKFEEIYPPKLLEFAYVTDGACTEKEILRKELIVSMTLDWRTSVVTINYWLSLFLQIAACKENKNRDLLCQQFSSHAFTQICQLLDLCILDVDCLQFSYSVLAASAIAHVFSKDVALNASGFKWIDIMSCAKWMQPFAATVSETGGVDPKFFKGVSVSDMHNIQTHNVGLHMLQKVQFKQAAKAENSPSNNKSLGIITPPQSSKKICLREISPQ